MQFVGIERRGAAPNAREIKNSDDLVDIHFFTVVLGRPAEQTEIIAHRCREIAAPDVIFDARAFVALAHFRSVLVKDERNMCVARRRHAECSENLYVLRRVREMIFASDHVRDFHFEIVDHIHEMENP